MLPEIKVTASLITDNMRKSTQEKEESCNKNCLGFILISLFAHFYDHALLILSIE